MRPMRTLTLAGLAAALLVPAVGPVAAQAPDRSRPPDLGPPPTLALPTVHRFTLSSGLPVILMEKHQVPLVQINLVVKTGSVMDPADRHGLASMTAAMLDEGAGDLDALGLADAVEFLGARLGISSGMHATTVSLHTPLSKLDAALGLMADVVLRPAFAAAELDRQRVQRLTQLIQARDEPRAIAAFAYDHALFGGGHPYGRQEIGSAESLRAMTSADLRAFHSTWFRPNNAALVVVGAVDADAVRARLEAAFGTWRPGDIPTVAVPEPAQVGRRSVILVDKPGAAQSEIRIGRIGVSRDTPDFHELIVMNTILGGSFSSRLNQNLREDKGYTYGARSGFAFLPTRGAFTASAAVQTAVTDSALVEFMMELRGIREQVSDDELTRGRNFVALRFPGRFETVSGIAGELDALFLYDLDPAFFADYVRQVLAVERDDVLRVAREYVDPDRMAIVIVGDRAEIEDDVRALALGPLTILSVDDVMGPRPEVTGS